MTVTKQRTLDYLEQEWGTYVERFHRLPEAEQNKRVQEMGYDSLRDLLAHVLAWWQEDMGIVRAIAEGREFERKKYDFDMFNAEAVARYRAWDEASFMAHIIGWWEEGLRVIPGILGTPGFTWREPDTDQFNRELIKRYLTWSNDDLVKHFDTVRLALIDLIASLPEDAFQNKDIESWLAEDVVEHYDEHALPR